jgi:hypothetical protein
MISVWSEKFAILEVLFPEIISLTGIDCFTLFDHIKELSVSFQSRMNRCLDESIRAQVDLGFGLLITLVLNKEHLIVLWLLLL